ncbi:MAG: hypothetical protein RR145_04185, partial [Oscillospiraceae bacterium]
MKKFKKVVTTIVALAVLGTALTGCGNTANTTGKTDGGTDKIKISIGEWPTENRPLEVERFNKMLK